MSNDNNNGNGNEMNEPLTGGGGGAGDDSASQSSQRSGASLLERIRAQRNREASAASQTVEQEATPSTIQVPQYSQVPTSQEASRDPLVAGAPEASNGHGNGGDHRSSGFFTQAWNNISSSMEQGMASLQQEQQESSGLEAHDALLVPTTGEDDEEENYSMCSYFTTFVHDVYKTFLDLPLWVRIVVVFALIYTAWKLI